MSFISPVATDASGKQRTTGATQSLGKDDFLQLLIKKLQNQDPLKPMDDESFIAELAQFSSLEQMNNIAGAMATANNLSTLEMQSLSNSTAAGLIGKEVKASYSGVFVESGNSPKISFTTEQAAKTISFAIKNSSGETVRTLTQDDVASGTNTITWDGKDEMGNRVADGYYSVEATGTNLAGTSFKPSMSVVGVVQSVLFHDGSAYLNIGGLEIPISDVIAVGEKGSFSS